MKTMPPIDPRVTVIIATFCRPELLRRALASLGDQGVALAGAVIVNNGGDPESAAVAAAVSPVPVRVVTPPANLGSAGGLAAGLAAAMENAGPTHFWIMDDDAVATPGALAAMLAALVAAKAEAASAMIPNAAGKVEWFPGPLAEPAWTLVKRGVTPGEFLAACGPAPLRWNWATWASLVVSRRAVEAVGLPDARLWYQGTDIEYTLRLSARFACVLAPAAVCPHLPPEQEDARRWLKELWSLQNGAYVAGRLPHGRRILRHQPGNLFRYWRRCGGTPRALFRGLAAIWRGGILGRPVGLDEYGRPPTAGPSRL